MDPENNIDFEATKKYVAGHSSLPDEQKATTMASFDGCVLVASAGGKIKPVVAFGCMNKALIENVRLSLF